MFKIKCNKIKRIYRNELMIAKIKHYKICVWKRKYDVFEKNLV